jgi:hypothetical protein
LASGRGVRPSLALTVVGVAMLGRDLPPARRASKRSARAHEPPVAPARQPALRAQSRPRALPRVALALTALSGDERSPPGARRDRSALCAFPPRGGG